MNLFEHPDTAAEYAAEDEELENESQPILAKMVFESAAAADSIKKMQDKIRELVDQGINQENKVISEGAGYMMWAEQLRSEAEKLFGTFEQKPPDVMPDPYAYNGVRSAIWATQNLSKNDLEAFKKISNI